ncbi:conserved hypothetical protein [uncultured Desulfobacterium sp.]|uniref:Zinc-ribbon 15 domain-containing protein n=1 Tax=uncultured Desulfobacterium sp. TaxID=201089 RepID=A0A445MZ70_9BACT|nr:conserved hypothetical protein [uncultured Desulfobacterium sp.]
MVKDVLHWIIAFLRISDFHQLSNVIISAAMFFLIAGIQPKTINIDDQPRRCPICGLYQARLKMVNHYLSVFFIPVLRVKKGTPFLECQRCGAISSESGELLSGNQAIGSLCPYCGGTIEPSFKYCPRCGRPV